MESTTSRDAVRGEHHQSRRGRSTLRYPRSTDVRGQKRRRQRRQYTDEFKAGAIRLMLVEGRSVTQVARDLDLTRSALDSGVRQAKADAGKGPPAVLTSAEKEELARGRRENKVLKVQCEILNKAATFFAKGQPAGAGALSGTPRVEAGFYAWKRRPEATHDVQDRRLGVLVIEAHKRSPETCRSPHAHLSPH